MSNSYKENLIIIFGEMPYYIGELGGHPFIGYLSAQTMWVARINFLGNQGTSSLCKAIELETFWFHFDFPLLFPPDFSK